MGYYWLEENMKKLVIAFSLVLFIARIENYGLPPPP
jgi:hypothetical protein